MAVPHPAATRESLLRAEHVHRSFHWFFFQLPQLPERALSADNYAFVDWLWDYWTVPGFTDEEHLAEVKRMLAVPGALEATLGYYRAMFDPARADPDLAEVRQAAGRPIVVPTLALCGAEDKRAEVMQDQARHFAGPYRFELVPGSSHFLQREQPQAVTKLVLDWFARQKPVPSRRIDGYSLTAPELAHPRIDAAYCSPNDRHKDSIWRMEPPFSRHAL